MACYCDLVYLIIPYFVLVGEWERSQGFDEISQVGYPITIFRGGSGLRNLRQ